MERQVIDLSEQAFILINGPLIVLNLIANIFYACCLIFPPSNRQRLKQPLKMLLVFLVWCSVIYCVSLAFLYLMLKESKSYEMFVVSWLIVLFYMHNSMTCSVWLNLFYYIQIVPSQRALLIWVKRNIRSVICMVLLLDGILFLFSAAVNVAGALLQTSSAFNYINDTWTEHLFEELYFTSQVCFFATKVHILISLCVMMVSSFYTVSYLQRHVRSVAQGDGCFSALRIQSQMRVTRTGISQAVLYLLFATFYVIDSFTHIFSPHFFLSAWISFTVTSLYISGTTVNLGIGQATFRQRAADVWKALKTLCGVGMVTSDVEMHSSQLTSGEIANTITVVQMSL